MGRKIHDAAWVIVAVSLVAVSGFALMTASSLDSVAFRLGAAADTYVSTTSPDALYGYETTIWVSKTGTAENWGLASFNVYSKLRSGDVIVSARIKLLVNGSSGQFPAIMMTGRLLADFSESTTTYNTRPAATFDPVTSTLFDKRPGPGKTVFVDVTRQLMKWRVSGQIGNFGVVFAMDPATVNAGIAFVSRENPNQEGPVLQIFTVPPGLYGYTLPRGGILAVRADI